MSLFNKSANRVFNEVACSGGRASGRTHSLIAGAHITGAIIVCANASEAKRIKQRYGIHTTHLEATYTLQGCGKPALFDHFAIECLWHEREREFQKQIEGLEAAIRDAERRAKEAEGFIRRTKKT